ncbi:MAG: LamG-like jellyroll fold domain-containing protein [Polyangiales bacterium]
MSKALVPVLFLMFALACGDDSTPMNGDGGSVDASVDGAVDTGFDIGIDPTLDTDEDGVTDVDELTIWHTSPTVADSDGDGFDDGIEINDLAFDPEVNNFQFNPLVADRPELDIELALAPVIYATYETTMGTSRSIGQERSMETRSANTGSWGGGRSYSVEESHTVGTSVGFSGWKLEASVSYEYSYSTTNETSSNWSREQSLENAMTEAEMETFESSNEISSSGGVLGISVLVRNPGNIAYFLDNLTLTAYELNPLDPQQISPVGTLTFLDGADTFPRTRLEPGEASAPLTFDAELDLPTVRALLRNSRNLMIAPATSLVEGDGTIDFELAATAVNARTAEIIIDFGQERESESYRVSTVSNGEENFITAETALSEILRIPFEEGTAPFRRTTDGPVEATDPMLTSVRNFGTDDETSSLWTVIHSYSIEAGASTQIDQYHPLDGEGLDFGALELRKGDTLQLVRIVDLDRDGLGERAEYAFGTDPENDDTDGDGCQDGFEVVGWLIGTGEDERRVRSNPTLPNTDFDVFNDCEEFENGTDPSDASNNPPTVDMEIETNDGVRGVFRVSYADGETEVVELLYSVDGGGDRVVDVRGQASPFDVEVMFTTGGDHEVSMRSSDGELLSDPVVQTYRVGAPSTGRTGYWPIRGTEDGSFSGTLDGGAAELQAVNIYFVTGRNGLGREAANTDFSESGIMTTSRVTLGDNFTMFAFVDFNNTNSGSDIFGQGDRFALTTTSNGLELKDLTGGSGGSVSIGDVNIGSNWTDGGFFLLAVTVEGDQIRLYVDGALVLTSTLPAANPDCELFFGQPTDFRCQNIERAQSFENGLRASFDDIHTFNRALTANEILATFIEM